MPRLVRLLALALTGLAALGASASVAAALPPAERKAGFLRHEQNKWLFFSCAQVQQAPAKKAARRGLVFADGSPDGAVFRAIQQRWQQSLDPTRGIYVEFAGYEEHGRITAVDLQRALGWVERCEHRPANIPRDALLWAAGHEPQWSLIYDGASGYLQLPDRSRIALSGLREQRKTGAVQLDAEGLRGGLRIDVFTELCSDTMAEAAFGRRVSVTVRGRVLQGCGLAR